MENKMFCYQCQEAAKGIGCTVRGVCGKSPQIASSLDILVYITKGISIVANKAREYNIEDEGINKFTIDALFISITNANFDEVRIIKEIKLGIKLRDNLIQRLKENGIELGESIHDSVIWTPKDDNSIIDKATFCGVLSTECEDRRSLRELILYGVKGIAAYTEHAWNLGYTDKDIYAFIQKALAATTDDAIPIDNLIALVMETGKYGVNTMAMLDKANTESYGNPEITEVNIGVSNNPGILISGHDLKDMEELLKQTDGSGVDVYTHSEMLPANYYPSFKKYKHFIGNYGNAWWKQNEEFESFNGPILMTTNCIIPPKDSYKNKIYTTGAAGYENTKHITPNSQGQKDFSAIIAHAKQCKPPIQIEEGKIVGGFAHAQVFALADKIVDAVKSGAIKKFVVMAGCDGRFKERNYYTEFAKMLPNDTIILTAGCAKYRYNKLKLGDIDGIPRVLDAGQCNDSYSLAIIALKLKEIFELNNINDLPIVYNIAWYEQKAVIVLLSLLYLGVKGIHLGPTLPAFLSTNVLNILIEKFGIGGIKSAKEDVKTFLS